MVRLITGIPGTSDELKKRDDHLNSIYQYKQVFLAVGESVVYMNERVIALAAVLSFLITAHFAGRIILLPVRSSLKSQAVHNLSAFVMGIGAIGIITGISGVLWGFSPLIIKVVYFVLAPAIIVYWAFTFTKISIPRFSSSPMSLLLLPIVIFHSLGYLSLGFSYISGSDSFSYILIAQEYLRQGLFAPMVLEPLGETMPIFKVPCLFEMVYLTLLAMSNLVAISLIAKIQFLTALFIVLFVSKDIGHSYTAWAAVAVILTEPIIAYFAQESADNYFLAVSFELLCLYYLWMFYNSRKTILLAYAGIFAGMMVSTKLTTIYYFVAVAGAIPFLISSSVESAKGSVLKMMGQMRTAGCLKSIAAFSFPAIMVGAIFPLLIYVKTNSAVMGMDWLINEFTGSSENSWTDPFYRIFYNHYMRYQDLFVTNPDLPYFYAGIKKLLSYYLVNPFRTHFSSDFGIFSHSPVSFAIGIVFPIYVIISKRTDHFSKLLAGILSFGYILKLISYPLLDPPKSEVFQLLPATILLSCCVNKWRSTNIREGTTYKYALRKQHALMNGNYGIIVVALVTILLPLVYINAYRLKDSYFDIKTNMLAPAETMAVRFNQQWYIDNLADDDVLFGRRPNEICYISEPKVIPFFWESMYFVPWRTIEKRINELNVTVIYDPSVPPGILSARYNNIMPIIEKRDKYLFCKLNKLFMLYEHNYRDKNNFFKKYYTAVGADNVGQIYRRIRE